MKSRKAKQKSGKRGRRTAASRIAGIAPRTAILFILLAIFIALSIGPVTRNLEATARLNRMEAELKKQRAVTESLEKDVAEATSLEYVEKEARRQRMVAQGEILYLITTNSPEKEVTYRVKALQSMDEAWARVRQMLHSVPLGENSAPDGP